MTDVSITAANCKATGTATVSHGNVAGATITAGQTVYKDATTGKYKLSDCDSATAADKDCDGIALNGASDGQPLSVVSKGTVTVGGTLVAGTVYVASATAGGIAPLADLTTGDDEIVLGVATSTTVLDLDINVTGVTL